jgi:mRNA interferase HigB
LLPWWEVLDSPCVWILEERTLKNFWKDHPDAKGPLAAWIREINNARYGTPVQLKAHHGSADFVGDKVIFDIGGNKYRLIVRIKYARLDVEPRLNGIVLVLFVGTHEQYDRLNVAAL